MARLTLDWFQLAAAVGSIQGLLLTGVLLSQRNNRTANRLLAALMIAFTVFLASTVYYTAGLVPAYPHFFGVSYPTPWLFGPLVYLYARAASDRSWRLTGSAWLHFAPAAMIMVISLPIYLTSGAEKVAFYERLIAGNVPRRIALLDPTKFVSGLGYSVATVAFVRAHWRAIEDNYSNTVRVNLRWLLWLTGAAAAIWILATALQFADVGRFRDDHVSLAMAIVVYAIGYMGLRQSEVFRFQTAELAIPQPDARYERSGLADGEAARLESALRRLMESDQPWKDSDLTLSELASRLGTTPHKLSEVLNARITQTFHDFVNGYRVREVQRRIEAGDARRLKMLSLAMDAGFASKSTFNQAFKKHTQNTPSEFARMIQDASGEHTILDLAAAEEVGRKADSLVVGRREVDDALRRRDD
jgi:AraC-like DNA-binding protein